MDELFQCFINEARFIRNLTAKTISTYQQAWTVYSRHCSAINHTELTTFVMSMRERGISASGCNSYIRSINSFLSWLHVNGHTRRSLPRPQAEVRETTRRGWESLLSPAGHGPLIPFIAIMNVRHRPRSHAKR